MLDTPSALLRPSERTLTRLSVLALLGSLLALAPGCASPGSPPIRIHESPKGSVYLEQLEKRSFHAEQPIVLHSSTLARVLTGVRVQKQERLLKSVLAGKSRWHAAFAHEEVEFLAPLLSDALAKAKPDQVVRFKVIERTDATPLTTGGAIYAKDSSLYLTLTHYQASAGRAKAGDKLKRAQLDPTGLQHQDVLFVPEGVERTDLSSPSGLVGPAHLRTLVIDYPLLDKLAKAQAADESLRTAPAQGGGPAPTAAEQAGATRRDLDFLEERLMQQDRDIQALKEELRHLQGEGGERE